MPLALSVTGVRPISVNMPAKNALPILRTLGISLVGAGHPRADDEVRLRR